MTRIITLIMALVTVLTVNAETFSYRFNSTPLSEAIREIAIGHPDLDINFIYNELENYKTSAKINTDNPYEALHQVIGLNPVTVVKYKNTYYVEALQHGKYEYNGYVVSKDEQPVIAATVLLLTPKDSTLLTYGITNEKGFFSIPCDRKSVIAKISCIGYKPILKRCDNFNVGVIEMTEDPFELNTLIVTFKNTVITPDRTVIYATQLDKERAANPFNMLTLLAYHAPQLQVRESEKTLSIDGEEPLVLVNGIPRSMSFISALNPSSIQRIEISNDVDIRYGKRYLNIITNRTQEGGWLMEDFTGAVTTPRFFLSGVAEYSVGKNDFMFYYNGGYRKGTKEYIDEEQKYSYPDKQISLNIDGEPSATLDTYNNFNFYYTHIHSDKSMFTSLGSLNLHDNNRNIYDYVRELTESFNRKNNRGYNSISPYLSLYYYLQNSETSTFEMNAIGSYNKNNTHRYLTYSTGYDSRVETSSDIWYVSGEALWKKKFPFASLNTGVNFGYNHASNKYDINNQVNKQSLTRINANLYSSLSGSTLTIDYNLSVGFTYYEIKKNMFSPNIILSLKKGLGNYFNISYNFRYNSQMPSLFNYNDVATPVNNLMYRIGSNNLKSQINYNNNLSFNFNKDKAFFSIKAKITNVNHPFITQYSFQDDRNKPLYEYFIESSENGNYYINYGTDFTVGFSNILDFLSFSTSTGWEYNQLKASEKYTFCSWHLDCNMGLYWKGWQVNMTAQNLVPAWRMFGGNDKIRWWPYTSLTIYKKIGKWNLHLSWNNILQRYGGHYRTESLSSIVKNSFEFKMKDQGNMIEIGVRYDFTNGKLLNKKSRSINLSNGGDNGIKYDY